MSFTVTAPNGMTATPLSGTTTTDGSGVATFNQVITLTDIGNGGQGGKSLSSLPSTIIRAVARLLPHRSQFQYPTVRHRDAPT